MAQLLTRQAMFEELLKSYARYYTIDRETPMAPFDAEARFSIHGEQYFLLKSAKWAEMDSAEYVFYAVREGLSAQEFCQLDELAWETGLARALPRENHRNTDVTLFIVTDELTEEARQAIRKSRHFKNYRFGLWGFSGYKVVAYEAGSGRTVSNYRGRALQDLFSKIQDSYRGKEKTV